MQNSCHFIWTDNQNFFTIFICLLNCLNFCRLWKKLVFFHSFFKEKFEIYLNCNELMLRYIVLFLHIKSSSQNLMDTTHGLGPWWWSSGQRACLPTIRVRISLTSTVFPVTFVFEKNENKQKEAGVGPLKISWKRFRGNKIKSSVFFFLNAEEIWFDNGNPML